MAQNAVMTSGAWQQELGRFCIVGTVGFVVDSSLTLALVGLASLAPVPARGLAFLVAATVTWQLNRRFTFAGAARGSLGRWALYLASTTLGAAVNVGVYALWVARFGAATHHLLLGIALGAVCALLLNFLLSKHLVFAPAGRSP
jgi:putative flippase GtrA